MELFRENGCLTDEALRQLIDGQLDEMGRLEAAEHLSFCDACLERYTALLTDDALETPQQPLAPKILTRVRQRVLRLFVNRYAVGAAAAVLALTLWGTGVFDRMVPQATFAVNETTQAQSEDEERGRRRGDAGSALFTGTNSFFQQMDQSVNGAMAWLMNPQMQTQTQE